MNDQVTARFRLFCLRPRVIDFHLEHFSDAHLATVLWDGVSGSAIPAWRQLDKADLEDVASYVQSIQAPVTSQSMTAAEFAAAGRIYSANCVSCHGAGGRGDGPSAGALKPSPVNFHVCQPSQARTWTVVNDGIPGSAMPAWKNTLTPDEVHLLIPYVLQTTTKNRTGLTHD